MDIKPKLQGDDKEKKQMTEEEFILTRVDNVLKVGLKNILYTSTPGESSDGTSLYYSKLTGTTCTKKGKKGGDSSTKVKRPMNSFMVFSHIMRKDITKNSPEMHNAIISKALGKVWKGFLAQNVKDQFAKEADELKRLHEKEFPGYKYRPQKKDQDKSTKVKKVTSQPRGVTKSKPRVSRSVKKLGKLGALTDMSVAMGDSLQHSPQHQVWASPISYGSPSSMSPQSNASSGLVDYDNSHMSFDMSPIAPTVGASSFLQAEPGTRNISLLHQQSFDSLSPASTGSSASFTFDLPSAGVDRAYFTGSNLLDDIALSDATADYQLTDLFNLRHDQLVPTEGMNLMDVLQTIML